MESFRYARAQDDTQAIALARRAKTAQQGADIRYIAGVTTLVDLMKLDVERPQTLIDITHLPLTEVKAAPGGVWRSEPWSATLIWRIIP
jgi:xanthine dehydrogenase YagS FAD-binding subunit